MSSTHSAPARRQIEGIQFLRALAATMVVFLHAQMQVGNHFVPNGYPDAILNSSTRLAELGNAGVDIFFVISGFIMAYVTDDSKRGSAASALHFLKSRLIRIVPLYWFYTSIVLILLLTLPHLFRTVFFDPYGVALSYLFIPYPQAVTGSSPILAVGWTLSYEMYFYALVTLGMFWRQKKFALLLGIYFMVSITAGQLFDVASPVLQLATNQLLLEFYLGFLIGLLFISKIKIPAFVPGVLFVAALLAFGLWMCEATNACVDSNRFLKFGVPAALLVAAVVTREKLKPLNPPALVTALGNSSYSLYLSHLFILQFLTKLLMATGLAKYISMDFYIIAACVCCLLGGYISYIFVESPLIRLARRIKAK